MSARTGSVTGLGKTRVEALTDGIFGAVMTVLGLSLTIPYITGPAQQKLPPIEDVVTGVLTYALSFVTLGVFWVGHHVGFQVLKRTDRTALATPRSEMRQIDRMAVLEPQPREGGEPPEGFDPPTCSLRNCRSPAHLQVRWEEPPEGFDPPTCSSFGAGVLRLHIRNCRSAGLS